jgi:hypothetical protein
LYEVLDRHELPSALHDIRRTLPKKIVLARNVFVLFAPFMLDARQLRGNLLRSEHSSHFGNKSG